MKRITIAREEERMEVFSPVFGPKEKDALREMLPPGAKMISVETTNEDVGGGFCFLFRQGCLERKIV